MVPQKYKEIEEGVVNPLYASYSSPAVRLGKWLSTIFVSLDRNNLVHLVDKLKYLDKKNNTRLANLDAIFM